MLRRPPRSTLFPYTNALPISQPVGRHQVEHGDVDPVAVEGGAAHEADRAQDRKSTRLNSSHVKISYAVFCLKKKKTAVEAPFKSPTIRASNGVLTVLSSFTSR